MEQSYGQQTEKIELQHLLWGFWKQLKRLWWLLVVLAVLGGSLMYVYTLRTYRPVYQAQAVFSVSVSYGNGTDIMDYANYYDYAAAKLAAETFPYLIRSEAMNQRLKQQLGVGYINGSISAASLGGTTNFFRMTVTSEDPQAAYDILRAVMEVYPQISRQVIGQTQLTVNREPVLPKEPKNPFAWRRNTFLGAAAGTALGAAVLVVLVLLSGTVYKPGELKPYMNLPCLATVPEARVKQRRKSAGTPLLVTHMDHEDPFCEAFRLLRLKLLRQMEERGEKVIVFSSALPSEGKSCVAANTALSLATIGKKVLLIDGDLRIQNLKNTLHIPQGTSGLGDVLGGTEAEPVPVPVGKTGMFLLAGDTPVRNPASLLRHERLSQILSSLRQQFDYIVIDTPPSLMMADAVSISRYADRVVYIVRQDYASRAQVVDGIQPFSEAGAKLAGFVFNRADTEDGNHYGYRYGYGYGKRYGYSGYKGHNS